MFKLKSSFVTKIADQSDFDEFIASLEIKSDSVIIKPNWVDGLDCSHTEVKALDLLLSALNKIDKKAVFVESYTFWRTDKMCIQGKKEDYLSSKEATVEEGKKHWDLFKRMDKWFLKKEGFDDLFRKYKAEYVNVTNEVWSGNVVNPADIIKLVKDKFSPLHFAELYSYVPKRLFDLKDSCFISFAKAKLDTFYGVSLSIKNLFGLIPDPCRAIKYHKDDDKYLIDAILDINKIYQTLFNLRFVVDGVFSACLMDFDTNTTVPYKNWGLIVGGSNGLEVDEIAGKLMKSELQHAIKELPGRYQQVFGGDYVNDFGQLPAEWFLVR